MRRAPSWVNRTVVGIVVATFFSDVSHEMVTAVLPMYLGSIGLGAAALGMLEGVADLLFSVSKLAGGVAGHHIENKRPIAAAGYLVTGLGTAAMALVHSVTGLMGLRAVAWMGRGFRSPLRDFLLADAVAPTEFGRAYGIERSADMLGAVVGPLIATALLFLHVDLRVVMLVSIVPAICAVVGIAVGGRGDRTDAGARTAGAAPRAKLPAGFWYLLVGVCLFGLGDFSRTFLILLAGKALGGGHGGGSLSTPVLLYAAHNVVSAIAALPAGRIGDRRSKLGVLLVGYALGVTTNLILAVGGTSLGVIIVAVLFSGVYIAIEEAIEKATAAELLPRELRSLGFGVLACANAVGDMVASVYAGAMIDAGRLELAFGVPAAVGLLGVIWLVAVRRQIVPRSS